MTGACLALAFLTSLVSGALSGGAVLLAYRWRRNRKFARLARELVWEMGERKGLRVVKR